MGVAAGHREETQQKNSTQQEQQPTPQDRPDGTQCVSQRALAHQLLTRAKEKQRIGILTGGGDCPGLNAVIRAACLTLDSHGHELLGIHDGFEGHLPDASPFIKPLPLHHELTVPVRGLFWKWLCKGLYQESYTALDPDQVATIYGEGGTILGVFRFTTWPRVIVSQFVFVAGTTNIGHYRLPLSEDAINRAAETYKKVQTALYRRRCQFQHPNEFSYVSLTLTA